MSAELDRKLLVVEDDEGLLRQLRWSLQRFKLLTASTRDAALAILHQEEPPVVLLDLGLPPHANGTREGFRTLDAILTATPTCKVIVMTGQEGKEHAIAAVGAGAYDFLGKPFDPELLAMVLDRAFNLSSLEAQYRVLRHERDTATLPGLIGDSPAMMEVVRMVKRLAPTDVSLVLTGESGTGKEVVAKALHAHGPRSSRRFVAINCAAIPANLLESELFGFERGAFTGALKQTQGKVELAHEGTLFLDEIGDLPLELQAKLLRFLQERTIERVGGRLEITVDTRVVCATHRNLEQLVANGHFRQDLYFRLAEVVLHLPPLRERPGDAVLLARHFLSALAAQNGKPVPRFTSDALRVLDAYQWPGNIRELQNRLKRALIMSDGKRIGVADLDLQDFHGEEVVLDLRRTRERAELVSVRRALAVAQGNLSQTARLLGISRPTLYDLLRQHHLRD